MLSEGKNHGNIGFILAKNYGKAMESTSKLTMSPVLS